jgi:hypothetical protein
VKKRFVTRPMTDECICDLRFFLMSRQGGQVLDNALRGKRALRNTEWRISP